LIFPRFAIHYTCEIIIARLIAAILQEGYLKRLVLSVLILTLFGGATVTAQLPDKTLVINGGMMLQAGGLKYDFRSSIGFGALLDYFLPVSENGITIVSSTGLLLNKMDLSFYEELYTYYDYPYGINQRFKAGYWLDIPIMTGIGFMKQISPNLEPFGAVQFGCSMILAPDINYESGEDFLYWDNTVVYGYALIGGVIINNNVSLAIHFYDFGTPAFNMSAPPSIHLGSPAINQSISFASINVGYCF